MTTAIRFLSSPVLLEFLEKLLDELSADSSPALQTKGQPPAFFEPT
jgi:hypothetical protein